ncbi:hypothetical protein Pan241w_33000 [Gimesia alba]|uniref:Uncharacterized protein n=1 Tax=Gimesia alba TaxID=2527973 RepID=A0A517RH57_9PLAN|nr:hypothetical protein [Gimesia alba]QDT43200.1 hypothetical protein Pan241w_33000 [Gimesia alba]
MTTFNQTESLSLPNDVDQRGSHNEFCRTPDYERILSFCLKRTTSDHSNRLERSHLKTRLATSDTESQTLISELSLLGQRAIQNTAELLDPRLKQLAAEYVGSSHSRRYEICEQLYQSLLTQSEPVRSQNELLEHIWGDLTNQSCNRIFARQFLKHGNPNCFGRALILHAFAQLANATVLGAMPLIPSSELSVRHDGLVAKWILRRAQKQNVKLRPELISFLQFIVKRPEIDRIRPLMFHMGLVFQISPACWVLIDPHAKAFGKYQNTALISHIEEISQQRPQEIFSADFRSETNLKSGNQIRQLKSLTRFLDQLQALSECPAGEALMAMAKSQFLDFVLSDDWNIPREQKEKIAAQLRGELAPVVEERCLEPLLETQHSRSTLCRIQAFLEYCSLLDCGKEFIGLLSFHVSADTQALRAEMLQVSFTELLSELIARFHGFLFNLCSLSHDQELLHPVIELYRPDFRVGVELISHVNAVTLRSETITRQLSHICQGQSVQLSAATEILRNPTESIRRSSRKAFEQLVTAETHSCRLQEVLKRISIKISHIQEQEIS